VVIAIPAVTTPREWCDFYNVPIREDGTVVLFKGVDTDYRTPQPHTFLYAPGSTPAAPDWDPKSECGQGLHFSPRPSATLQFNPDAKRFVACPVRLDEIVVHHHLARYPSKVKAPRVCAPCWEVDIDGNARSSK
jgi:hypothetical protein